MTRVHARKSSYRVDRSKMWGDGGGGARSTFWTPGTQGRLSHMLTSPKCVYDARIVHHSREMSITAEKCPLQQRNLHNSREMLGHSPTVPQESASRQTCRRWRQGGGCPGAVCFDSLCRSTCGWQGGGSTWRGALGEVVAQEPGSGGDHHYDVRRHHHPRHCASPSVHPRIQPTLPSLLLLL